MNICSCCCLHGQNTVQTMMPDFINSTWLHSILHTQKKSGPSHILSVVGTALLSSNTSLALMLAFVLFTYVNYPETKKLLDSRSLPTWVKGTPGNTGCNINLWQSTLCTPWKIGLNTICTDFVYDDLQGCKSELNSDPYHTGGHFVSSFF